MGFTSFYPSYGLKRTLEIQELSDAVYPEVEKSLVTISSAKAELK